jgi:hypothetical protein
MTVGLPVEVGVHAYFGSSTAWDYLFFCQEELRFLILQKS